jgi:hypothetical protein
MNATPSGFSSLQTHFILESAPPPSDSFHIGQGWPSNFSAIGTMICEDYRFSVSVLFAFRSIPDTLRSPAFVRIAFRVAEITRQRLAAFVYRFACPGAPRKEMAVLSSSQATPVCTCTARRLRWCPLDSPWRLQDWRLPSNPERRLSQALAGLSSRTTNIRFSELSHAACTLATPGFTHTFTGYACRFAIDSAAHLFWWDLRGRPYSPTG